MAVYKLWLNSVHSFLRYGAKTEIKGRNSVANLRKTTIYFTNVDLINDDVYTKFGLILSIRSQDIE